MKDEQDSHTAEFPVLAAGSAIRYPHNELEGFGMGALLDLRARIAIQLLQTSPRYASFRGNTGVECMNPRDTAEDALDVAAQLMAQAEARGWVKPLDTNGELTAATRAQGRRLGAFQVAQQLGAQQAAQEEQPRVATPVRGRMDS